MHFRNVFGKKSLEDVPRKILGKDVHSVNFFGTYFGKI